MDKCSLRKSLPMVRKIERRGYKLMYLSSFLPELNSIEQFLAIFKRDILLTEEKMSDRIAKACIAIPAEIVYTLPVIQNGKSFNLMIKLYSKRFEVEKYISFLGQTYN